MAKLKEGEQIEHYRIDGVVAQGPMSSVFKGTDLRTNQPVAIKAPQMAARECDVSGQSSAMVRELPSA